jgi:c-di-GMP-binding flagellar brake protein YcgR
VPAAEFVDVRDLVDVTLDQTVGTFIAAVTAVTDDGLALEAPTDATGRYVLPPAGMTGLMVWRGSLGLMQVRVTIATVTPPPAPIWHVQLTGTPAKCQRRAFVRTDTLLPVVLQHDEDSYAATAVDISEGGMRCRVPDWPELAPGHAMTVELDVGAPLTVAAHAVRLKRGVKGEPADVSLRFTGVRVSDGDRIRQFVFSQLQLARSKGLV